MACQSIFKNKKHKIILIVISLGLAIVLSSFPAFIKSGEFKYRILERLSHSYKAIQDDTIYYMDIYPYKLFTRKEVFLLVINKKNGIKPEESIDEFFEYDTENNFHIYERSDEDKYILYTGKDEDDFKYRMIHDSSIGEENFIVDFEEIDDGK